MTHVTMMYNLCTTQAKLLDTAHNYQPQFYRHKYAVFQVRRADQHLHQPAPLNSLYTQVEDSIYGPAPSQEPSPQNANRSSFFSPFLCDAESGGAISCDGRGQDADSVTASRVSVTASRDSVTASTGWTRVLIDADNHSIRWLNSDVHAMYFVISETDGDRKDQGPVLY